MRVLIVSKFLRHVGGVETYLSWLGRALSGGGSTVGFFGMDSPLPADPVYETAEFVAFAPDQDYHGSAVQKIRGATSAVYSFEVARQVSRRYREFSPGCRALAWDVLSINFERDARDISVGHSDPADCSRVQISLRKSTLLGRLCQY